MTRGIVTRTFGVALDGARAIRDLADTETPPDGQPVSEPEAQVQRAPAAASSKPRPKKSRPTWSAVVGMCVASILAGDPIWEQVRGSDDQARALELGELRGHVAALEGRINSGEAADLKAAADRAVEWREIDAKIVVLGENLETALATLGVAPANRRALPVTSQETLDRHRDAELAYRNAKRSAERRQIEQSIADSGTVISQ